MSPVEIVAIALDKSEDELTQWSDGTVTVKGNDRREYIVCKKQKSCYMGFLGEIKDYFIYIN